jgi:hypothetical protein
MPTFWKTYCLHLQGWRDIHFIRTNGLIWRGMSCVCVGLCPYLPCQLVGRLVGCFVTLALKMETVCLSEMLELAYKITWCQTPKHHHHHHLASCWRFQRKYLLHTVFRLCRHFRETYYCHHQGWSGECWNADSLYRDGIGHGSRHRDCKLCARDKVVRGCHQVNWRQPFLGHQKLWQLQERRKKVVGPDDKGRTLLWNTGRQLKYYTMQESRLSLFTLLWEPQMWQKHCWSKMFFKNP